MIRTILCEISCLPGLYPRKTEVNLMLFVISSNLTFSFPRRSDAHQLTVTLSLRMRGTLTPCLMVMTAVTIVGLQRNPATNIQHAPENWQDRI